MLELASLSRAFGGLVVIDRLDFKVDEGEILGILGPNGAGKTTPSRISTTSSGMAISMEI